MLIPPNCAYVNVQCLLPTFERSTDVRISSGGETGGKKESKRNRKAVSKGLLNIKMAVRSTFYLKAAKNRGEEVRTCALPVLICSSQAAARHLHCTSAFTLSATFKNWLVVW